MRAERSCRAAKASGSRSRALLADTDIVLLDEATASVDPAAEAAIQRAINELVSGKTVVIIAHRLRTVQRAARIVVLDRGRVSEVGRHAELLAQNGMYAKLWRAQQGARGFHRPTPLPQAAPPSAP